MNEPTRHARRRDVLGATGVVAALGLAGCVGGGSGSDPTPEQELATPALGPSDAPVTVAAFEDFACPHCKSYSLEVAPRIRTDYVESGDVRYQWYDFPIPVDPEQSWLAANAARSVWANADAADETFFSFTHAVFENQLSLSLSLYERLAADVGVDGATVREAAKNRTYKSTVEANRATGKDRGVRGTPTVFVDDRKLVAPSYDQLSSAIDDALGGA